jgi:membrane dipeptidase
VSVNVGYAPHDAEAALAVLGSFRRQVDRDDRFVLAASTDDIAYAHAEGRLAVGFDLEDSNPLDGDLGLVRRYYELGVRSLLPSYNYGNAAGCGCLDGDDTGLSAYGRDLVGEMNRVGMVVDGSHCSVRTGLDMCAVSRQPVIYSHSCMRTVWDHPRNITDEQAVACAETGGVIGITGVGIFLGPNDISIDAFVRHIDYAVDLVGPEHVGVSTDFPFDHADFNREIRENPELFPESFTRWGPIRFMPPEDLPPVGAALADRGYPASDIAAILGGNFLRVARQVWKPVGHV